MTRQPLDDVRGVVVGDRLVGRLLARLLTDQGAQLEHVAQLDQVRTKIKDAHLLIDATPDGTLDAAGLSFDALISDAGNGLIYCSLPVYPPGSGIAEPRKGDADDLLVAAEMGINLMDGPQPRVEELPVGSAFGAILAAGYVTAALLRRDPSPQHVVVPLTSATLTTVARRIIKADDETLTDPVAGPRLPIAARYECADGRYVQSQGGYLRFVDAFIGVVNRPEWLESAREAHGGLPTKQAEEEWRARFAEVFAQRSASQWEDDINAAGGACTVVRSREEWLSEQHARDAHIVISDGGDVRCGPGVRVISAEAPAAPPRAANSASEANPPLAGTVVIDLSIVLAGPTCGRTLSDLGADVIKVDDPTRPISPYGWLEVNRGKRSVLLDLRRETGREVLWRLIEGADVVIENYRHGKLDELGFGFHDVVKVQPDIVYASLNAFDRGGAWAARAGWEQNAQAATGMQIARGGDGRTPAQVPFPLNDFGTGLLGAYGVMLALRQRDKTGLAQHVVASLARTATFIASPLFEDSTAQTCDVRWLPCSDGFVALVHDANDVAASDLLVQAKQIASDASGRNEAAEKLRAIGLTCAAVRHTDELPSVPWIRSNELTVDWDHPRWGRLHQARPRGWASTFEPSPSYPARDPGDDSSAVLRECGYDDGEIEHLFRSSVVSSAPLFEMWTLS